MKPFSPSVSPKKWYLIDAIGALLTAFMLGVVLTRFQGFFGMPPKVLLALSQLGLLFALFSFLHFVTFSTNGINGLRVIAIANLLYCCLTIFLVFYFWEPITIWGIFYFAMEILVIVVLARKELKVFKANS